jgi:hypothetical protein
MAARMDAAFIYYSIAKRQDTSSRDVDIMIINDALRYPDIFAALENASARLGRTVNHTIYSKRRARTTDSATYRVRHQGTRVTQDLADW